MSYISRDDIKIQIKIFGSEKLLAKATVIFLGTIETHGWRVMVSKKEHPVFGEYLWIQAPSFKTSKGYKEIVYIDDKKSWELVQELIYDAYHMARSKKVGLEGTKLVSKETGPENKEGDDFDDIPF